MMRLERFMGVVSCRKRFCTTHVLSEIAHATCRYFGLLAVTSPIDDGTLTAIDESVLTLVLLVIYRFPH